MITNNGKALWANAIGDLGNGFTGTVKASTSTTLEPNEPTKVGWKAEQFVGQDVYAGGFVGTVISNTTEELTVARWENLPSAEYPAHSRAEKAPEPPLASSVFFIASGATPAAWVAVSADTAEPKAENTTLKGEINTTGGALVRALAKFTYLGPGESTKYKVEVTFTANGVDELPINLAKIGIFNAQRAGIMMFESLLTATAEIKASGDSVTIVDVVTGS